MIINLYTYIYTYIHI